MEFQLSIAWNGKPVLEARLTGVMAYDILCRVALEQFAGIAAREGAAPIPTLRAIMSLPPGESRTVTLSDDTGELIATVTRVGAGE